MRRISILTLLAAACASSPPPAASSPSLSSSSSSNVCALSTSWLVQALGEEPQSSVIVGLDAMRHQPAWASALASTEPRGQFISTEFADAAPSSEEIYAWIGLGEILVVRHPSRRTPCANASGCRYGSPTQLPSGVIEYSANPGALYAFADGTWVRVADAMVPRFRAAFESSAASPPLPATAPNTALQVCKIHPKFEDFKGIAAWAAENMGADRASLRWLADGDLEHAELDFSFSSPAAAARAERETRVRCAEVKCPMMSSTVEGSIARYRTGISSPFR